MNSEFIAMLDSIERERGISRPTLIAMLTDAMLTASRRKFTAATRGLSINIHPKTGLIKATAKLIVREVATNPHDEISLVKAQQIKPDAIAGEEIEVPIAPNDLGRIAAQAARQALIQGFTQIEKRKIFEEFRDRKGELMTGTVSRFERSDVIIDFEQFTGRMPARERVLTEDYNIGDKVRTYVVSVENGSREPEIILSRTHPSFIRRLFEVEVSEISEGIVEIKALAREPGFRTKIAVASSDSKVDAVGACVGQRGVRVKNIVRELNNEKVDIVPWFDDPGEFVHAALKPATVQSVSVDVANHKVNVTVKKEDLSLAIGRKGQNVRLTSKLTGWDIDVKEDMTAAQAIASHTQQAAQGITDTLPITAKEAETLAAAGMTDAELIATADAQSITEVLACEPARAEEILKAAIAATQPSKEEQVG